MTLFESYPSLTSAWHQISIAKLVGLELKMTINCRPWASIVDPHWNEMWQGRCHKPTPQTTQETDEIENILQWEVAAMADVLKLSQAS